MTILGVIAIMAGLILVYIGYANITFGDFTRKIFNG